MTQQIELIRNFCPKCWKTSKSILKCDDCGNEDLIPTPVGETLGREETNVGTPIMPKNPATIDWGKLTPEAREDLTDEEALDTIEYIEEIEEEEEEKSKLQLDTNAVSKLLNEPFGFLTGVAGSGKSTLINEVNRLHPTLLEICATTGIAAVNLNSKTINSVLKYFDTKSLENAWQDQLLHMNLRKVRAHRQKLLIDEVSMLDAEQLNLIINAVDDINSDNTGKQLGVWITGDFLQLKPVKGNYAFKSDYWDRFENNTIKLTKIWRQDNLDFVSAVNLVREGKGKEAVSALKNCGVTITSKIDNYFDGSTIIPLNKDVDAFNEKRLREISMPLIRVTSRKRGKVLSEWDRLIPVELRLKVGALVMILSNDTPAFTYVNGDLATIESYDVDKEVFYVKLKRNDSTIPIKKIKRENFSDKEPEKYLFTPTFSPYLDYKTGDWIIGTIEYFPLRLAWATSLHKSQGLSLDRVQVDTTPRFFGDGGMSYVAISRARTPNNLILVGRELDIIKKVNTNPEVKKFI